ncbi:MAG: twin-arginine translocase subunit TatC [Gaiellaceae bacterium]
MRRVFPRRMRHGEEATLVEHLGELRTRLLIALLVLAGGFVLSMAFHETLIEWLTRPLPDERRLVTFGVTEPFFTAVKVSLFGAFALAFPVLVYQLWSFMAPAIEEHTQRIVSTFVVFASVLFAAGVAFGYTVVLPRAIEFLTTFDDELYDVQIRASYYYSFVSLALIGLGLVFEMPIFILTLVRLRVLTAAKLRRNRRLGIFVIVVLAVLLPTVDPVSLALEIAPMLVLFELSIWLSAVMERRWARAGVLWAAPE